MERISQILADPVWWFSTIAIAILVNLISAILWRLSENRWARYSTARAERLAREQASRSERIVNIRGSNRELILALRTEMRLRYFAILMFTNALLVYLFTSTPPILSAVGKSVAIVLVLLGIHAMSRSESKASEIDDGATPSSTGNRADADGSGPDPAV